MALKKYNHERVFVMILSDLITKLNVEYIMIKKDCYERLEKKEFLQLLIEYDRGIELYNHNFNDLDKDFLSITVNPLKEEVEMILTNEFITIFLK